MTYNTDTVMRRSFFIPLFICALVVFAPSAAHAAITLPIQIVPDACNCAHSVTANGVTVPFSAPAWGCVLQVFQNVLNALVSLATILLTIFIAWAGFTYMTSPTNPGARQKANARILNTTLGLLIILASWLLVDSVMKVLYNSASFGPWNAILVDSTPGSDCLAPSAKPGPLPGIAAPSNTGGGLGSSQTPTTLSTPNGPGACSASNVQAAAAAGGSPISASDAASLACVAKFESACGSTLQNYKWGQGSSAYGAFQVTLQGNSACYNNAACEQAVGATGPLNCASGFRDGNPIPGSTVAQTCIRAASNLGCNAAAGACVLHSQGISAWTADSHSTGQGSCGS